VAGLTPGLIVNADDLGVHPDTNAGILSAYRRGILTSATMLFTTPYLQQTVDEFVRPGALPIGIHLDLTMGKGAAGRRQTPRLVDEEGVLKLTAREIVAHRFAGDDGRALLDEIRLELAAQFARARDCGVRLTHADSHQHVHMNPAIFSLVEELAPRYGVGRLRLSREPLVPAAIADLAASGKLINAVKWALLRASSRRIASKLATNDAFFGIVHSGIMSRRALEIAIRAARPDQSVEICIHPGFRAPAGSAVYPQPAYNRFMMSGARQMEHDALVDAGVADLARRRGLMLRSFDGRAKS
jgi:predicted glycoside hydrolase/deacetylase ChbG (UPF0249 family)